MTACLCVAFGGAIGSVLRYLISLIDFKSATAFPYATLIVNVIGSFLIGLIVAFAVVKIDANPNLILFLKVGICGGFTTFSTFALESTQMIQSGKIWLAILYILLSIVLSMGAIVGAQCIIK